MSYPGGCFIPPIPGVGVLLRHYGVGASYSRNPGGHVGRGPLDRAAGELPQGMGQAAAQNALICISWSIQTSLQWWLKRNNLSLGNLWSFHPAGDYHHQRQCLGSSLGVVRGAQKPWPLWQTEFSLNARELIGVREALQYFAKQNKCSPQLNINFSHLSNKCKERNTCSP